MTVKSVGVFSCARLAAMIYMAFGFVVGLGFSLAALAGFDIGAASSGEMPSWLAPVFGVGALVLLPIAYCVMGFLGGLLGSWVFNLAAAAMGGLELVVEQVG